jgi:hypothetical protein
MRRRQFINLLAAAAAAPSAAFAYGGRMVPIERMFPHLSMFLQVPLAQRNRFYLAYRAVRDQWPVSDPRASIIAANGARIPLVFDRTGAVVSPPTLAELKSGAVVVFDGPPFQLELELRCAVAITNRMDVGDLSRSLSQVNQDVARLAGPIAIFAPKITAAFFPDAGRAVAIMGDGEQIGLPIYYAPQVGSVPYIEPARMIGARTVALTKPPSRVVLAGHPRST